MALSVNDFGKAVVAAGLLPADDLKALVAALAVDTRPRTAAAMAKLLVEQSHLTGYQADELLAGRGTGLVLGDYIVQDKIGAGGMGQVLKAEHRKMGRTVALKLMSASAMRDEAAIKRFHREVRAAARLEHENIVTAHAAGEANGMHYLVMQCVEGSDLSGRVKKEGPLSVDLAMDCICQAARGLAYAHSEGIIHRDIKPANLLLDKKGVVKILDMGLARIDGGDAHDGLTGTEQVLGTVDYMSPEQAVSTRDCDARADIYSLGCTLWYLLTGTKMYPGDTAIQRLMQHREAPLPSLLKARDDIPWALEKLFHKMVAKQPGDRCQTMDEVVREIEQIRGSPESARTSGLEGDTNLGQFFIAVGGKESSRSGTQVKVATGKLSTKDESTVGHSDSLKVPKSSRGQEPPWKNPKVLAGAGAAALLLLLGVWFIVRNKDGNEVARLEVPQGSTVEMQPKLDKEETTKTAKAASPSKPGETTTPPETPGPKPPIVPASAGDATGTKVKADVPWPYDPQDGREYTWSEPENLGPKVNDKNGQITPTLSADELCLIVKDSNRKGGSSDLWEFRRKITSEPWGDGVQLKGTDYESYPSLSADGLTLLFSSGGWKKGEEGQGKGDIWIRQRAKRDDPWGPPKNLGAPINTADNEQGAALSPDGLALVFASDRPGGQGSWDLWLSRRPKLDAPWGPPENLRDINVSGNDESAVFVGDDKHLLIAEGGNVRVAVADSKGKWSRPQLPKQEVKYLSPWLAPDGRTLYFHLRDAKLPGVQGHDDIYVTRRVPNETLSTPGGSRGANGVTLADLQRGLVGHWNFEEGQGTVASDSSGNKNDGKLEGLDAAKAWQADAPPSPLAGKKSLEFDGKGGVSLPHAASLELSNAMSLALWCKPVKDVEYTNNVRLVEKNDFIGFGINGSSGKELSFRLVTKSNSNVDVKVPAPAPTEPWMHVVLNYDEKRQALYINGKVAFNRDANWPLSVGGGRLFFGMASIGDKNAFTGRMDDVRLYNRALSEAEIAVLAGKAPLVPIATPGAIPAVVYLDDLKETESKVGYGKLGKNGLDQNGKPITWDSKQTAHALATHPPKEGAASVNYALAGKYDVFETTVCILPGRSGLLSTPLTFRVLGDGRELWKSSPLKQPNDGAPVAVSVRGVNDLQLEVLCPGSNGNAIAVWINPRLTPVAATGAIPAVVYLDDLPEKSFVAKDNRLRKPGKDDSDAKEFKAAFPETSPDHTMILRPDRRVAQVKYDLAGAYATFQSTVQTRGNQVDPLYIEVLGDGKSLWKSADLTKNKAGVELSVDVRNVRELTLTVPTDILLDGAYALWLEPRLTPLSSPQPLAPRSPSRPRRSRSAGTAICWSISKPNGTTRGPRPRSSVATWRPPTARKNVTGSGKPSWDLTRLCSPREAVFI